MPLNPPHVGRLSVCSKTVVMQHQLPNAEISLHKDSVSFDLGPAKSVLEVMNLPPGLTLTRDDHVLATQSLNGETSPPSVPSIVQGTGPSPSLPHPHRDSHIYRCAGHVALAGMTPGSTAEIRRSGTLLGTALAHEGRAIVRLSAAVPSSPGLEARAITCGHAPVSVTLPRGDPAPLDASERLAAPSFASPLMDCVEWLRIDAAVPGATVFFTREDGSVQSWAFATRSWLVPLAKPLEEGEHVRLRQEFPLCRIGGHEVEARVGRLALGKPTLASPWCTGRVTATDLVPGATVILFEEDGTEIGRSGASGTTCQFTVVQPSSAKLFARQELCGKVSDPSNSVSTGTNPDLTPPQPVIVEPVRQCQTQVRVTGQVKGGLIEIWSHSRGMIGWRHSMGAETTVDVAALQGGELIEANAVTCAGQSATSPRVTAQGLGDLRTPFVEAPLHEGATSVRVREVTVGAQVDVYVDGQFVNGQVAEANPAELTVPALVAGQRVHARQHLCGQVRLGEPTIVIHAPDPKPKPDPTEGFSKVLVHNCHWERRTVNVWVLDHTAGTKTRVGSLEHDYDDWGSCPVYGEPLEVELEDGHVLEVVVVDPGGPMCEGQDDPLIAGCRRDERVFLGDSSGLTVPWIVA